jgi:hypothetical protein
MNPAQQFQILGRKELAIQQGIAMMEDARSELARTRQSADRWGATAILANLTLIPLNCIVNAYGAKLPSAKSVYDTVKQELAKEAYGRYAKSGTRLEGKPKMLLSALKKIVTGELERRSKQAFIPGANILVGFAEDAWAAWQTIQLVDAGSQEMTGLLLSVDRKIGAAKAQLLQIQIRRADLLDGAMRTA